MTIDGPFVWRGEELARSTDWIRHLTADDVRELEQALDVARGRVRAWSDMTRDEFPLPRLGRTLAEVGDALEHGRGVVLLRGFPVARHDEDALRWLYWGLGTHLGAGRFQNAFGELIGEVRDEVRYYGEIKQPGVGPTVAPTSRARARTKLTAAQNEALDVLADVAEELCHSMELEPGDIHGVRGRRGDAPGPPAVPSLAVGAEQPAVAGRIRVALAVGRARRAARRRAPDGRARSRELGEGRRVVCVRALRRRSMSTASGTAWIGRSRRV